jgi:DNA-binding MarR family transcriptional regulator
VTESGRETGDPEIVRQLLSSIARDSAITQRKLAGHLGIALGLANAYLRHCIRKGYVKVTRVPLNRYAYYVTPQGFAEKSRLTAAYFSASLHFFRRARGDCGVLLARCAADGWSRVALYGAGDLAEIAILSAGEAGIEVVCVIDEDKSGRRLAGRPIVATLEAARLAAGASGLDGVIVTDTTAPQPRFDALLATAVANGFAAERILAPDLLGISVTSILEPLHAASEETDFERGIR